MMTPPTILHEDDAIIAVAKPPGIATANVPAGEESVFTVVKGLIARRKPPRGEPFIGVVSRLDKPVSGVVVFAKTRESAASLAGQFRTRSVRKTYVALVEGRFPAPLGQWVEWRDTIERPMDEPETTDQTGQAIGPNGRAERAQTAELKARVVKRAGEVSLVELNPATGRRHQIRAQLAAHGCPIVGDRMYRARLPFPQGIALHARELVFEHPITGEPCRLVAEFPPAWRPRFSALLAAIPLKER